MSNLCACGCRKECRRKYLPGHCNRVNVGLYEYEDRGYKTPCWIWLQKKDKSGYGRVCRTGYKSTGAHRHMYEMFNGPIPEGLHLDHLCKVPSCVRPEHLEPVTNAENVQRGNRSKISHEIAEKIRELRASGMMLKDIESIVGIDRSAVGKVARGTRWKEVINAVAS